MPIDRGKKVPPTQPLPPKPPSSLISKIKGVIEDSPDDDTIKSIIEKQNAQDKIIAGLVEALNRNTNILIKRIDYIQQNQQDMVALKTERDLFKNLYSELLEKTQGKKK